MKVHMEDAGNTQDFSIKDLQMTNTSFLLLFMKSTSGTLCLMDNEI